MAASPLRYPGGKAKLFGYFAEVVKKNDLYRSTYCEPYAGGAGLALKLLSMGFVENISLNDIDESIFAFWTSALHTPDEFCTLLDGVDATIDEWHRQKAIWQARDVSKPLTLGFAAFFLNRTNRSGIIEGAGPIGGYEQKSVWTLDVRLNKSQLIKTIQGLQAFRERISLSNLDAIDFIEEKFKSDNTFCYLDPPYYVKGSKLYRNFYRHEDHCRIRDVLARNRSAKWVVSYDDAPQIREIYTGFYPVSYSLNYSAGRKSTGSEVIYFSDSLNAPEVTGFELSAA